MSTRIGKVRAGTFQIDPTDDDPREGIWLQGEVVPDWVLDRIDHPRIFDITVVEDDDD